MYKKYRSQIWQIIMLLCVIGILIGEIMPKNAFSETTEAKIVETNGIPLIVNWDGKSDVTIKGEDGTSTTYNPEQVLAFNETAIIIGKAVYDGVITDNAYTNAMAELANDDTLAGYTGVENLASKAGVAATTTAGAKIGSSIGGVLGGAVGAGIGFITSGTISHFSDSSSASYEIDIYKDSQNSEVNYEAYQNYLNNSGYDATALEQEALFYATMSEDDLEYFNKPQSTVYEEGGDIEEFANKQEEIRENFKNNLSEEKQAKYDGYELPNEDTGTFIKVRESTKSVAWLEGADDVNVEAESMDAVESAEKLGEIKASNSALYEQKEEYEESFASDDIIEGVSYRIHNVLYSALDSVIENIQVGLVENNFFKVNLDALNTYIGNSGEVNSQNSAFNSFFSSEFIRIMQYIGAVFATVIFFYNIFILFFNGRLTESKDTVFKALGRYAISIFLLYYARDIVTFIIEFFSDVFSVSLFNNSIPSIKLEQLCDVWTWNEESGDYINGALTFCATHFLGQLVILLVMWPIIKSFFSLLIEIIERYLVTGLLLLSSPIAFSCVASKDSSKVALSFFKMLMSQAILIFTNSIFIYGFSRLSVNGVPAGSVTGYFFTLAYLTAARRFDDYLKTMGLTIAHTGGNLFQEASQAARNIVSFGKTTARTANSGRKLTGVGMTALGVKTGVKPLVQLGQVVGVSARSIENSFRDGLGGIASSTRATSIIGGAGVEQKGKVSDNKVMDALQNMTKNPITDNQNVVRGMGAKNVAKTLSNSMPMNPEVSRLNLADARNGNLNFMAKYNNGSKDSISVPTTLSGRQLSNYSAPLVDNNGEETGMYLSSSNILANGEQLSIDKDSNVSPESLLYATGIQNMKMMNDIGFNYKSLDSVENKMDVLYYKDKDGTVLGHMNLKEIDGEVTNRMYCGSPQLNPITPNPDKKPKRKRNK